VILKGQRVDISTKKTTHIICMLKINKKANVKKLVINITFLVSTDCLYELWKAQMKNMRASKIGSKITEPI